MSDPEWVDSRIRTIITGEEWEPDDPDTKPTLTTTLPFVCKAWHSYANLSDALWRGAIVRQLIAEPAIWGYPVQHQYPQLLASPPGDGSPSPSASCAHKASGIDLAATLPPLPASSINETMGEPSTGVEVESTCRAHQWYRFLHENHAHLQPAMPVFVSPLSSASTTPGPIQYVLHLSEPRHSHYLRAVLRHQVQSRVHRREQQQLQAALTEAEEKTDAAPDAIYFLHAPKGLPRHRLCESYESLARPGRLAKPGVEMRLVRLISLSYQDTPANIKAVPLEVAGLVKLDRWAVRPDTGGLPFATGRFVTRYRKCS
jgi:hypothetical protein